MLRLLLALAVLGSGCATSGYRSCDRPSGAEAVIALLAAPLVLAAAVADAADRHEQPPPPPPPRPTVAPLLVTVSWESGGRVAGITVTVHSASGFVIMQTETDQ